jgi:hypothetical protein
MATPPALACDAHSAQAAAAVTPRMVLPIEFRAMPNLLLRVNRPLHREDNIRVIHLHCHWAAPMQPRTAKQARRGVQAAIMRIVIVAIVAIPGARHFG